MKKAISIILSMLLIMGISFQTAASSTTAVKSIKFDSNKITLKVGQSANLKVTFIPANTSQKKLTYVSGDKEIAAVDAAGRITGVTAGTATITAYTLNKKIFAQCSVTISLLVKGSAVYYMAPNGRDTNNGTLKAPFKTLDKVWKVIKPGDTVYLRGGKYSLVNQPYLKGVNGTPGKGINIWAYPGETPVITRGPEYKANYGLYFSGDYFHWRGLEITGFKQSKEGNVSMGLAAYACNYCTFELMNVHDNGCGMVMRGGASGGFGAATGNLILNSDFHHNADPYTPGYAYGNADGLDIDGINNGNTNTVKGCRFWYNTDDGLDFCTNEGAMLVENCWSWRNGYLPDNTAPGGDGNGYKIGVSGDYPDQVLRTYKNCLSFFNATHGWTQNNANCICVFYNNTAYHNADERNTAPTFGFNLKLGPNCYNLLKNNISYKSFTSIYNQNEGSAISTNSTQENNSWNGKVTVSDKDFVSLDIAGVDGARQSDGSLPELKFLKLAPDSDLIDSGTNAGIPFKGSAPDLGAFEYGSGKDTVIPLPTPAPAPTPIPGTIIIDGKASDWSGVTPVATATGQDAKSLKVKSDAKYLYFCIEGNNLGPHDSILLDTDNSPDTGLIREYWTNTGFDYVLEEEHVMRKTTHNADWDWVNLGQKDMVVCANSTVVEIKLPKAAIYDLNSTIKVGFEERTGTWEIDCLLPVSGSSLPSYSE